MELSDPQQKPIDSHAELTGLEPATPAVTGRCSDQLSYNSSRLGKEGYRSPPANTQVFYQCQRCGNCCRWPGFVILTEPDARALAHGLGLSPETFANQFCDLHPSRTRLVLKTRPGGECIFLEGLNHCRVQPFKPSQCRGFPNRWRFEGWRERCEALESPFPP